METDIKYNAEYQRQGDDTWYIAGDIYGYDTPYDAEMAVDRQMGKDPNIQVWRMTKRTSTWEIMP